MSPGRPIYLDHGATTPVDERVVEAMSLYWSEAYGNASSVHRFGQEAERALEHARADIAGLINAAADEIIFTGCGTESDNLALRGAMLAARASGRGNHLITSAVEHDAVLNTARQLQKLHGIDLTIVGVDRYGHVDPDDVRAAIRPNTALISIMAANNEIGTMQPIEAIGNIARDHEIPFHTDAIQAASLQTWDMTIVPVDLASFSPHKFYGPKGIGLLFARRGIELVPWLTGGAQEDGRRAGSANVPLAVGAASAFHLAQSSQRADVEHYERLRDRLIDGVCASVPEACALTGHPTDRLPHHASFAFQDLRGNDLLMHLDVAGFAAGSGSACKTGDPSPSAVLAAIGLGSRWTRGGLRLTVGRQNTADEIARFLEVLPGIVAKLHRIGRLVT